jgi:hypothetical protein
MSRSSTPLPLVLSSKPHPWRSCRASSPWCPWLCQPQRLTAPSRLRPGLPRFAVLFPVVMLFTATHLAFTFSANIQAHSGPGGLLPRLAASLFIFTALLPVKLRRRDNRVVLDESVTMTLAPELQARLHDLVEGGT